MIFNFSNAWEQEIEKTWNSHIHVAIIVTNCTVLLVTFFVGIAANLFVTYAVYNQKSLQTSTNALLVNLAVIDLLRCATDCPLLLGVVLNEYNTRDLGDILCDGQVMSFSLSCCVQLFTLASISAERHQAIANPFKSSQRQKRVKVWIPLTWAVAIVVSTLCVIFTKDSSIYVRCRALRLDALKTHDSFGRYILLPIWSVCLALIVGFYSHIFILVKAHNRKIFDKGVSAQSNKKDPEDKKKAQEFVVAKVAIVTEPVAPKDTQDAQGGNGPAHGTQTCSGSPKENQRTIPMVESQPFPTDIKTVDVNTEENHEHGVIVLPELHHNITDLIDLENGAENPDDRPRDSEIPDSDQVPSVATSSQIVTFTQYELNNHTDLKHGEKNTSEPPEDEKKPNLELVPPAADTQAASAEQDMAVMGEVCMMPSFANKERGNKKKESRLAKRSGYIILTFIVFWMPLIATVLLNTFLKRKQFSEEVDVLVVSIACMTSLTNPIIYAAVNPQFRTEFYSLKARCKALCTKS